MLWIVPYVFGYPGSGYVIICTDPVQDLSINQQKNLDSYYFFYFLSLKIGVNVPSKSNKQKLWKKLIFFGILSATDEISEAGSESEPGSVSQWCGFVDPDPYQNVTDPKHWFLMHGRWTTRVWRRRRGVRGTCPTTWMWRRSPSCGRTSVFSTPSRARLSGSKA